MCGGWTGNLPAISSVPPGIVVVSRPDNRTLVDKYGREVGLGGGAVLAAGFCLRKMTRRRGSDE
jgi:hypothetical protein